MREREKKWQKMALSASQFLPDRSIWHYEVRVQHHIMMDIFITVVVILKYVSKFGSAAVTNQFIGVFAEG